MATVQAAAAEPGGLIAIRGLTRTGVDRCCAGERAWIAIANGTDAFVVGGTHAALAAVERRARAEGGQVTPLPVGIASHTPLLETATALFRAELSTALSDTDEAVRLAALNGATHINVFTHVDQVATLISDPSAAVRRRAAETLGTMKIGDSVMGLIALTSPSNESDAGVRAAAVWALGQIADTQARDAVSAATNDTDAGVRDAASIALYRL